jgi:hypothetical protein
MMMTEWLLHLACEPFACRVDCGNDKMTRRRKMKKQERERPHYMGRRITQWGKGHEMMGRKMK